MANFENLVGYGFAEVMSPTQAIMKVKHDFLGFL
jgi:hypothetical protein